MESDDKYRARRREQLERYSKATGLCVCFLASRQWRADPNCRRCFGEGVFKHTSEWRPYEPCKLNPLDEIMASLEAQPTVVPDVELSQEFINAMCSDAD